MEDVLQIRVGCEFHGSASERSPAVFQLQPFSGEAHKILEESWNTEPDVARHEYFDSYGNRCQRLTVPQGERFIRFRCSRGAMYFINSSVKYDLAH